MSSSRTCQGPIRPAALALVLGVCMLVGLAGPAAPAQAASAIPACASPGLVVWMQTEGNATAGPIYYQLQFTNLSGRTCTLGGYPGVSGIGLSGRQLGKAAARESSSRPRVVKLADGATAKATLRIVPGGFYSAASCGPLTAAGLRVYPPDQRSAKTIPFPFEACSRRGPTYLTVGPVRQNP